MKRAPLTLAALLLFAITSFAQSYEGTVEYNKKKQRAILIDFPYPPEATENAIRQKMEKLGYKARDEKGLFNKDKGFFVYKNAFITDISANSMDYIVKVERKSRKASDESILYIIVSKNDANMVEKFDAYDMERAKSFLNNLTSEVEAANLELQIIAQEEVVAKAEKKFKGLKDDKEDMENRIKKLQDDIKKNLGDQDATQKDIENQKQSLELLKGKRRN